MGRAVWPRCISPTCNMRVMKEGRLCNRCNPPPRSERIESPEDMKRRQEKRSSQKRAAGFSSQFEGC